MSTLKSVESLLDAKIIKINADGVGSDGHKINCEESREFIRNYAQQNNLPMENISAYEYPPEIWAEKLAADRTIPPQYKDRARIYSREVRALIAGVGKSGIEDAGEWEVRTHKYVKKFTNKQECLNYINQEYEKSLQILGATPYMCSYQHEVRDPETKKNRKVTSYIRIENLNDFAENVKFTVSSVHNLMPAQVVLRDNVKGVVDQILEKDKERWNKQFSMFKRVRPIGYHTTLGDWWKQVPII